MSIESDLSSIAKSLETIANVLSKQAVTAAPAPAVTAAPAPAPVVPVAPPNVTFTPAVAPVPTPVATPVAATPTGITKDQFVTTIIDTYKALGPIKGAAIQEVLAAIGAKNINDVPADKYESVLAAVTALKA